MILELLCQNAIGCGRISIGTCILAEHLTPGSRRSIALRQLALGQRYASRASRLRPGTLLDKKWTINLISSDVEIDCGAHYHGREVAYCVMSQ